MYTIALLFAASRHDSSYPEKSWRREWSIACQNPLFEVHCFNYDSFLEGQALECELASQHNLPTILRCHPMSPENYKRLAHDLSLHGYKLITDALTAFSCTWDYRVVHNPRLSKYLLDKTNVGALFGSCGGDYEPATVYVIRDDDGPLFDFEGEYFIIGQHSSSTYEQRVNDFIREKGNTFTGEAFFELYAPRVCYEGRPVVYRVFYYNGEAFFQSSLAPIRERENDNNEDRTELARESARKVPTPPQQMVDAFRNIGHNTFYACDFTLIAGGGWVCTRIFDGQMSQVFRRHHLKEFYASFSQVIAAGPKIPAWIWCLTATVQAENVIGEDKRPVHGTRHFRPGTKVFLHPPNWDDRVAAIGIPRYANKYVRIVMSIHKLEHFSLEKVSNPELVAALQHPYGSWPFVRMAQTYVGRGVWDQSDECKQRIEHTIAYLTESTS